MNNLEKLQELTDELKEYLKLSGYYWMNILNVVYSFPSI